MNKYIDIIIKEAKKAYKHGEIPVGALITYKDKIIAKAYNTKQKTNRVINHAEILCIIKASKKLKTWHLNDCILYVTLEPCKMCKEVIRQSRIKTVKYLLKSNFNNEDKKNIIYEEVINNKKTSYSDLLKEFFSSKR